MQDVPVFDYLDVHIRDWLYPVCGTTISDSSSARFMARVYSYADRRLPTLSAAGLIIHQLTIVLPQQVSVTKPSVIELAHKLMRVVDESEGQPDRWRVYEAKLLQHVIGQGAHDVLLLTLQMADTSTLLHEQKRRAAFLEYEMEDMLDAIRTMIHNAMPKDDLGRVSPQNLIQGGYNLARWRSEFRRRHTFDGIMLMRKMAPSLIHNLESVAEVYVKTVLRRIDAESLPQIL